MVFVGHLFSVAVWNKKQGKTMLEGKDLRPRSVIP
jgi:hypothetical protein